MLCTMVHKCSFYIFHKRYNKQIQYKYSNSYKSFYKVKKCFRCYVSLYKSGNKIRKQHKKPYSHKYR